MKDLFFLDIETVPGHGTIEELDPVMKEFRDEKYSKFKTEEQTDQDYRMSQAGLIPEFGKIVCISVGCEFNGEFTAKSFKGHDEKKLLIEFLKMYRPTERKLVGHNLKYFDLPYIIRRCLIHKLEIPKALEVLDNPPRKNNHIDTMDMYKNGGSRCSLGVISYLLTGKNPKTDISGADVGKVYRESIIDTADGQQSLALDRITEYCERDIEATYGIYKAMIEQAKKTDPYFTEPNPQ